VSPEEERSEDEWVAARKELRTISAELRLKEQEVAVLTELATRARRERDELWRREGEARCKEREMFEALPRENEDDGE
jgi:hypothetical protein